MGKFRHRLMQPPILTCSVDAIVPLADLSLDGYFSMLRTQVLPGIRSLEKDEGIIWFSFLIHDRETGDRSDLPPHITGAFLHVRFGLPDGTDQGDFMLKLPVPFIHPIIKPLGPIGGIDISVMGGDWAMAWWMVGESSDWVLKLVEAHSGDVPIPLQQTAQFLHYITNGLLIGGRSILFSGEFLLF